jgi:hypothetical protein
VAFALLPAMQIGGDPGSQATHAASKQAFGHCVFTVQSPPPAGQAITLLLMHVSKAPAVHGILSLHDSWLPNMALSTGGAITTISMANRAPITAAMAQTFARARVSAPIICPVAYITAAIITISMATIGNRLSRPAQSSEAAWTVLVISDCANATATQEASRNRARYTPRIIHAAELNIIKVVLNTSL